MTQSEVRVCYWVNTLKNVILDYTSSENGLKDVPTDRKRMSKRPQEIYIRPTFDKRSIRTTFMEEGE